MEVTFLNLCLTLTFAALVIKIINVLQAYRKKWMTFTKLPGPAQTPYPPFGHALLLSGDSSDFNDALTRISRDNIIANGKEAGCVWLGTEPLVLVTGPNAAEVMMRSSEHSEKNFMYDFFHPWLGTGLLTSKGEKWKSRRKLLTPSFHFSILTEFINGMNDQAAILTKKMETHAETGQSFDIFKPITLCALDIICETAMGEHVNAQDCADSEYVRAVCRITELVTERVRSPWLFSDFLYYNLSSHGKEFRKVLGVLHGFTEWVINDRMSQLKGKEETGRKRRLAFLDLLIDASKKGEKLSILDIREEVDTFMFEGHDTTAAGMAWAVHLIGSHPDVQKRIHDELDTIFAGDRTRPITSDDLKKMEYLEIVLKESLRVLPSVPLIGRVTTSDCNIGGYEIPARTSCTICIQVINSHPDYWINPEKFDPERFTADNSEGRHPYAYLSFSAGPRNCIGQKFAQMEEKIVLAHLLRKFEIKSCDKTQNIRKMADSILRPGSGINVVITKRKD